MTIVTYLKTKSSGFLATSALSLGVVSQSWPLPFLINTSQILMNNKYDRDLPADFVAAEEARSRNEALNVLGLVQQKAHMKRVRSQAIRAQYIQPDEVTG